MSGAAGERLTDLDRRIVRAIVEEIGSTPAPTELGRMGVPAALSGLVVLVGWPRISDLVPGGDFVSPFVVLLGLIMLLGGPAVVLMGRRGGRRAGEAAVEAALRRLEDPDSHRETLLRAAALLVVHAYLQEGPNTTTAFDAGAVASRIEPVVPLVQAVEAYLVSEGLADPVFTPAEEGD